MNGLAQFSAMAAIIIGGFGSIAFVFTWREAGRLGSRLDRVEGDVRELRRAIAKQMRAP